MTRTEAINLFQEYIEADGNVGTSTGSMLAYFREKRDRIREKIIVAMTAALPHEDEVEAAAQAMHEELVGGPDVPWETAPEFWKVGYRGSARAALGAVARLRTPIGGWRLDTNDQVEKLAKECGWDNRRYMTPEDYQIWCDRMRKFALLAMAPAAARAQAVEQVAAQKIEGTA